MYIIWQLLKKNVTLPGGKVRYAHVNRNTINSNRKHGNNEPTITVKDGLTNYYGRDVVIRGEVRLTQEESQLSCGARVYIITDGEVIIKQ